MLLLKVLVELEIVVFADQGQISVAFNLHEFVRVLRWRQPKNFTVVEGLSMLLFCGIFR